MVPGSKVREISQINKFNTLNSFLLKPENIILSLGERNILYDKLTKLFWSQSKDFDKEAFKPALTAFFSKFATALQANNNIKAYLTLLYIPAPTTVIKEFEEFFSACLADFLFKYPVLKSQVLK